MDNFKLKDNQLQVVGNHMVEDRPKDPYLQSYPGKYFSGVVNPIKKRVRQLNLNIDSKFRDNYYSTIPTNFNFFLNQQINNVLQMELSTIEIPSSVYVISKQTGNNFFYIDLPDSNESQLIEIQSGNYDLTGFETELNNQLSIIGAPYSDIRFQIYKQGDNGTGQMMVGLATGVTPFNFNLDFQKNISGVNTESTPLMLKLGWIMGFRNGLYTKNTNYLSEGIVDLLGPKYLYLVIDDFNTSVNNNFYAEFNSSLLNKNILERLSLNAGIDYKYQLINITNTPREYFGPVNINNFNVQLLDTYGRLVDLNNMDFSFCLNLTIEYDI